MTYLSRVKNTLLNLQIINMCSTPYKIGYTELGASSGWIATVVMVERHVHWRIRRWACRSKSKPSAFKIPILSPVSNGSFSVQKFLSRCWEAIPDWSLAFLYWSLKRNSRNHTDLLIYWFCVFNGFFLVTQFVNPQFILCISILYNVLNVQLDVQGGTFLLSSHSAKTMNSLISCRLA